MFTCSSCEMKGRLLLLLNAKQADWSGSVPTSDIIMHEQVLLVIFIIAVMPRSSPTDLFTPSTPDITVRTDDLVQQGKEANPLPSGGSTSEVYAVVIDAGSTGSRVHVVRFLENQGVLELQNDTLHHLKPGLSSYADDPDAAAQSLQPLMDLALKTVPKHLQVGYQNKGARPTASDMSVSSRARTEAFHGWQWSSAYALVCLGD